MEEFGPTVCEIVEWYSEIVEQQINSKHVDKIVAIFLCLSLNFKPKLLSVACFETKKKPLHFLSTWRFLVRTKIAPYLSTPSIYSLNAFRRKI